MPTMKAAVFLEPGKVALQERPIPEIGPEDAMLRITTTTIRGTDVHILKGEYPVTSGRIVGHEPTTLCPGGKERMRRLMNIVAGGRVDLKPLVTHRFRLEEIEEAYDLFAHQRDGVLKVAITP
jgi:threonine dehydrogenase-like Zn-dependent dehydrogenase